MKELKAYVDQKNKWNQLFNKNSSGLDITRPSDRQRVASMIDAELSPENLTCDGELPAATV